MDMMLLRFMDIVSVFATNLGAQWASSFPTQTNSKPFPILLLEDRVTNTINKSFDVLGQHRNTQLKDQPKHSFISSITIAGCAAPSNHSTTNPKQSLSRANKILQRHKDQISSNVVKHTDHRVNEYPILFELSKEGADDSSTVGFSALCGLQQRANYHLLYAQDFSLEKDEIVAVDSEYLSLFVHCRINNVC
jgi:hypothetical protein